MKAFYCVGTHWDREWYEPFQEFRMWLVELIDEVMDLMERDPEYKCFHLDGQAIVLEDYLEIRPEQRDRLTRFLRDRRLLVGPWYNLPDEWLISGESFVRNLMKGIRICRDFGVAPMRFAYTPDQFGHVAALPMIMAGFGLPCGICWRGTQDETHPAQFVWVGPDGSRMVTHKLKDKGGYDPFRMHVRNPVRDADFSDASIKDHFDPYLDIEKNRAHAPLMLMLDAVDHQRPDPEMPRLLKLLRDRYPDVEFVWGSLEEYGQEMLRHADALPERTGELRMPCRTADRTYQYLIVHTLSSRYPIKRRNGECQALLEKWAEPLALFQMLDGGAPTLRYLDRAWTHLMKNHPHDSICGCSIDQVHRDMRYRFDQCEMIGDGLVRRAVAHVGAASVDDDAWKNLVVHNPLPFRRKEIVDIAIPFPTDYADKTGFAFIDGLATSERLNKFHLLNAAGDRIPYQHARIDRGVAFKHLNAAGRKHTAHADVYHLSLELDLPPCGHTTLRVEGTHDATRTFGSLRTGPLSASNGVIALQVHHDGTASLRLETSGRAFDGLFCYEDCGDSGDGWTRGPLSDDVVFRTPGNSVATAIEEDGPLRTVFRVERELLLPRRIDKPHYRRSDDRVSLRVTDFLRIDKHPPCLRVRTILRNTVRDHRLRVLFPSGVSADRSFAETPFAVVERDVAIPPETAHWQERVNPETAFTSYFGVQDARGGLAVLSPWGLHEYEVMQTPERALALTLFRATAQTAGTSGEPDGELLEEMTFDYQLWPFAAPFDPVRAWRLVAAQQAGVRAHSAAKPPEDRSFLALEHGLAVVTAIKPAHDERAGVVRLWNPTDAPVEELIRLGAPVAEAHLCNLNEEPLTPITLSDSGIPVPVPPRGLATVLFKWR
ncbi:MAG TPA: glycoside hydrolase family 38 C-terminal domain-containing protein [Candidatus Hydrogenedentes bacterium]|nr:glycoside hydrolase family 38 C-terminal domain-containing protein [Candidatus Hydrogenedentota bacterium]HNT87104.1 glycoside hydrolase family 38 C-terminal domain-containing protein [Candidatus Hydrogenedentota bacterium]